MKRIRFARTPLTLMCLLTPLSLGAAPAAEEHAPLTIEPLPPEPRADVAKENLRLRMEVELLKSGVARLESRVKELEAGKPAPPKPAPRPTPPRVVPKAPRQPRFAPREGFPPKPTVPRPLPEGWREREFNGMKFYIVPLKPGEVKSAIAKPAGPTTVAPTPKLDLRPVQK